MTTAWDEMVVVGRVARAHGNRGHVVVNPETDFPDERFRAGSTVYVRRQDRVEPLVMTAVRFHGGRPIVGLDGIGTMNEADALAHAELRVPPDALHVLPAGSFYRHDLVGCTVRTTGGCEIGRVTGVEGPACGSRLVVDGSRGEVLVPMAREICVGIDLAARTIVIEAPDGLLDLNAPGSGGADRGV
jgi:16S rRNA processing protein RimM